MKRSALAFLNCLLVFAVSAAVASETGTDALRQQVEDTERAFAQTMADRDFGAFVSFLSPEAIFFSGETVLRGSEQVAANWKPYFEPAEAPFSWRPETVEVLDSGGLGLSSGPVYDPGGNLVGTFTSIWRLDENDEWKIIFDKGNKACSE